MVSQLTPVGSSLWLCGSMLCTSPASFERRASPDLAPLGVPANESCPALLSRYSGYVKTDTARQIECCTSERQRELLTRLRFSSCDGAQVGVRQMLEAMSGRTIAFVGDSVQHQVFNAVVFDLFRAAIPFSTKMRDPDKVLPPSTFDESRGCVSNARGAKNGGSEVSFHFRPGALTQSCSVTGFTQRSHDFTHCRNLPVEEVYVPLTDTRLLWYRMNGNCARP